MAEHEEDFAEEGDLLAEARIIQKYKDRVKNPISAIRAHCVECMGGQVHEVQRCTAPQCSLYPFRMGKNTLHAKYGKARTDLKKPEEPQKRRRRKVVV
jgi:hypothetical protein